MTGPDIFDLDRFVTAQDEVFEQVMEELRAGEKRSHWMWFIFPQFIGLGQSPMSRRYAIRSTGEAAAYLEHGTLGARYREAVEALLQHQGRSAHDIFGSPDDLKLHSSLTLFSSVAPDDGLFQGALLRFFRGARDLSTVRLIGGPA
ncbi:DUF1810 domain-containing protein [Mesorhizobium sp. RP14(2022)]|uniref:DUF1810 domain-containing protein n=1 Tax=Mesorhizobium liriopis TaxID=2953882 RepID=A0ABT1C5J8_9HYPH|nr:DUF1810 domain-containing protein [Mesorhizobium liriopis]MCO6050096.1 DUF1810 domain-containing protein [Mesorhizobium liriopis]